MKTLFLIRHGKSSWANESVSDYDRPLKDRGIEDAHKIVEHLKEKGVSPDLIISSPANRALSTAKIFSKVLEYSEEKILIKEDIYFGSSFEIKNTFKSLDNKVNTVFIFGHNPYITEVVNDYTDEIIINVPTSGTACITSEADTWLEFETKSPKMQYFYYPKMFQSEG